MDPRPAIEDALALLRDSYFFQRQAITNALELTRKKGSPTKVRMALVRAFQSVQRCQQAYRYQQDTPLLSLIKESTDYDELTDVLDALSKALRLLSDIRELPNRLRTEPAPALRG